MHFLLGQLLTNSGVVAQIGLSADNKTWDAGAVVMDLGEPFLTDVLERRGRGHRKADQKNIRLGVGEWAKAVVILLTSGIEETKGVRLVSNPDRTEQLLEHASLS